MKIDQIDASSFSNITNKLTKLNEEQKENIGREVTMEELKKIIRNSKE